MSARTREIESLLYWPKELATLIVEYSTLVQRDRVELLLSHPSNQLVIIPGNKYSTLSMHWTDIIGHTQIFLRYSGFQSRELKIEDISRMACTSRPYGWNNQVFYRHLWDFFEKGCSEPLDVMDDFIAAFKGLLAAIE